jgi:hypothetical protein
MSRSRPLSAFRPAPPGARRCRAVTRRPRRRNSRAASSRKRSAAGSELGLGVLEHRFRLATLSSGDERPAGERATARGLNPRAHRACVLGGSEDDGVLDVDTIDNCE